MPVTPVQEWSDALLTSLAAAMAMFFGAVPRLIGFVLIVVVGWFIASLIGKLAATLLRAVHFNDLARKSGFAGFVDKMGVENDSAGFLAELAKWFIRLIALVVAFDALGLPAVSEVLRQLLLWLPNLVVAMVVLVIGGLAAKALSNLVRGSTAEAGLSNSDLLAKIASIAVWSFAIVIAVNQLGIAATLVNTLFMGFVGALALGAGLAFGLGGRETAAELIRQWHRGGQQAKAKIEVATERATERTSERVGETLLAQAAEVSRQGPTGPVSPRGAE